MHRLTKHRPCAVVCWCWRHCGPLPSGRKSDMTHALHHMIHDSKMLICLAMFSLWVPIFKICWPRFMWIHVLLLGFDHIVTASPCYEVASCNRWGVDFCHRYGWALESRCFVQELFDDRFSVAWPDIFCVCHIFFHRVVDLHHLCFQKGSRT